MEATGFNLNILQNSVNFNQKTKQTMNLDKKIEKSVRDKNEAQEEEALLFMNPFPGFDVI